MCVCLYHVSDVQVSFSLIYGFFMFCSKWRTTPVVEEVFAGVSALAAGVAVVVAAGAVEEAAGPAEEKPRIRR